MSTIFINYRRDDSGTDALLLSKELAGKIGDCDIFIDVRNIPAGRNFVQELQDRVATCDVLLAVMGPDWLDICDDQGKRRLEDPEDHVRVEIAAALGREIPVIPILINDTKMPRRELLPSDLRTLLKQNARRLRHDTYDADFSQLLAELKQLVEKAQKAAKQRAREERKAASARLARMPEDIPEALKECLWGSFAGVVVGSILYTALGWLISTNSASETRLAAAIPVLASATILTLLANKKLFEWPMFRAATLVGYFSAGILAMLHAWLSSIRMGYLPADNSLTVFFLSFVVPLLFVVIRLRYRNGPDFWRHLLE